MDIPPDLTSELSKAFETAIGKIAQSVVPTIAGAIATWMLKGEWQRLHTRPRRGFWAPFFKDKLVVVIGKFTGADVPAATSFEASGLVGTGDLFAFGALIASFHTVGQPAPAVAGGETADPLTLANNLVSIGGRDVNPVTGDLLRRIGPSLEFGNHKRDIWAKDLVTQRIFKPWAGSPVTERILPVENKDRPLRDWDIERDYCVLVKARNPHAMDKHVLLVFGGFGYGTWAGATFVGSDNLWKAALQRRSVPVRWWHRISGLILGQYSGLPESFVCVVEAQIKNGSPLEAVPAYVRELKPKASLAHTAGRHGTRQTL